MDWTQDSELTSGAPSRSGCAWAVPGQPASGTDAEPCSDRLRFPHRRCERNRGSGGPPHPTRIKEQSRQDPTPQPEATLRSSPQGVGPEGVTSFHYAISAAVMSRRLIASGSFRPRTGLVDCVAASVGPGGRRPTRSRAEQLSRGGGNARILEHSQRASLYRLFSGAAAPTDCQGTRGHRWLRLSGQWNDIAVRPAGISPRAQCCWAVTAR